MKMKKYLADGYFEKVTDVSVEYLKENNIHAVLVDLDNTTLDLKGNILEGLEKWHEKVAAEGIEVMILTNSNQKKRIKKVAKALDIHYILFACKPFKRGFKKAQKILDLPYENIALIGDQIYTDILGANKVGMHSILVDPIIESTDYFFTIIKRPFERRIKETYYLEYENGEYVNPEMGNIIDEEDEKNENKEEYTEENDN